MNDFINSGIWNFISATIAILALLVTMIIEWQKLSEKFKEIKKFLSDFWTGAIKGSVAFLIAGFFFWVIISLITRTLNMNSIPWYKLVWGDLLESLYWLPIGALLGGLIQTLGLLHSNRTEKIASAIIGLIIGYVIASVFSLVVYIPVLFQNPVTTPAFEVIAAFSGFGIGGAVSGIVIGVFLSGIFREIFSKLFRNT